MCYMGPFLKKRQSKVAAVRFDRTTLGLWALHSSSELRCFLVRGRQTLMFILVVLVGRTGHVDMWANYCK